MLNILLTHDETKRIISFHKGGEVKEFHHLFLQVFSDARPPRLAFAICGWRWQNDVYEIKYSVCVCVMLPRQMLSSSDMLTTSKNT